MKSTRIKEQEKEIQKQFDKALKVYSLKKFRGDGFKLSEGVILLLRYSFNYKNCKLAVKLMYAPKFLDELFWHIYGIEDENKNIPYYRRFCDKESFGYEMMDFTLDIVKEDSDHFIIFKNRIYELLSRNEEKIKNAGHPYSYIEKLFEILYETSYSAYFAELLMCYIKLNHLKIAYQLAKWKINNDDIGPRIKSFKNGIEKGIYNYVVEYCENHMSEDIELAVQDVNVIDAIGSNDKDIELLLIDTLNWTNVDDHWSLLKEKMDTYFHYIVSGQIINYKKNFSEYSIKIRITFIDDIPKIVEEKLLEIKDNLRRLHHIQLEWEIG